MPFERVNKATFHIFAVIAAAASGAVFLGALGNGFVSWDDPGYVVENPFVRTLAPGPAFTHVVLSNWHPLTMLSYAVDFGFWGLDPFGYHLTNIVIHAINAYLVAVLTLKLLTDADKAGKLSGPALIYASIFSALVFGVHPLRVESVAWVAERKDVLYGFFYLLALIQYMTYGRRKNGWAASYALSFVFFALAIMSKPMAVTLPVVLLILDFYPLGRFNAGPMKKLFMEKVPFFVLSAASAIVTLWAQTKAIAPLKAVPFGVRAAIAVRAYAFYLYKTVLPAGLAPFYPMPVRPFDGAFVISIFALAGLAVLSVAAARRARAVPAAFLYYLVTLLPVVGLVQVGGQAAADRYTYLPLLGVTVPLSAGAALVFDRSRRAAVIILVAITLALSALTIRQVPVWKDSLALWSRVIDIYPGRVALSYVDRGAELSALGRYGEALKDFNEAIRIDPAFMLGYNDRGVTRMRLKAYKDAVKDFDAALSLDPRNPDIYQNRGISYFHLKEYGLAVADLERAAAISPENGVYWYHLGRACAAWGDVPCAKESFKKALGLGVEEAGEELRKAAGQGTAS